MRTRSIAAALLISFSPVLGGANAFAQSGDDTTTQEVKARFHEGVDLFDAGQFEAARNKFRQAYALKPLPDILFNLAWSSLKSSHPVDAERDFERFLREGKDIDAAKRDDVMKGLAEARGKNGHIEIAAPPGTDVMIDNDHAGTAPFTDAMPVDPGAHVVKFQTPDGASQTLSVSVLANQTQPARFGSYAAPPSPPTAPPTTTDTPPPPTSKPPTPSSPNERDDPNTASTNPAAPSTLTAAPDTTERKKLFAPPKNLVPVYVGVGIGIAGLATGLIMLVIKGGAQNNVDSVVSQIKANGGTSSNTCTTPTAKFQKACGALQDDINAVNADAMVGNVAVAVGIAALVGTGIYWLAATKNDDSTKTAASKPHTTIAPILGRGVGGLSILGTF